jgi:hypothetical protein
LEAAREVGHRRPEQIADGRSAPAAGSAGVGGFLVGKHKRLQSHGRFNQHGRGGELAEYAEIARQMEYDADACAVRVTGTQDSSSPAAQPPANAPSMLIVD